jgi:hypothetical protein
LAQSVESFDLAADRAGFVGLQVLTPIDVAKASGNFGVIPLEQLLNNPDTERAPGTGYQRVRFSFTPSTYTTLEHGLEVPVDNTESTMYDSYFKSEQISAELAIDGVLRSMEIRIATICQATGTFANAAAAYGWSTHATATPLEDVETAVESIFAACGLWPNAIVIPRQTFRQLRLVAEIQNLIKYSGLQDPSPEKITPNAIAALFDLERVLVAGGAQNTANEGQSGSIAGIWSKSSVFVFRGDWGDNPKRPCVGRTFHWDEAGSAIGGTMESYPEPQTNGEVIRCRNQTDELTIIAKAGNIITNAY